MLPGLFTFTGEPWFPREPSPSRSDFRQAKPAFITVFFKTWWCICCTLFLVSLILYNTFTKKEEEFLPLQKGKVTMYTCGPTVYGRPHIGNYSSFLLADLLRRWLETGHNYAVTHVKNITDVGHLLRDRDHGEDKVERQAKEEKGTKSVTSDDVLGIARKYEKQYREDEKKLNFIEPEHRPRATETIQEMIAMIELLFERDHAYETDDRLYFFL